MAKNGDGGNAETRKIEDIAREQGAARQTRVGIDERTVKTSYANLFLASATVDEVIVTFGLDMANPAAQGQQPPQAQPVQQPDRIFQLNDRVIMNYFTAKRLALALGQMIRQHESQFGEVELDVAKRRKDPVK